MQIETLPMEPLETVVVHGVVVGIGYCRDEDGVQIREVLANTWLGADESRTLKEEKKIAAESARIARRLVACWNACRSIATKVLEGSRIEVRALPAFGPCEICCKPDEECNCLSLDQEALSLIYENLSVHRRFPEVESYADYVRYWDESQSKWFRITVTEDQD